MNAIITVVAQGETIAELTKAASEGVAYASAALMGMDKNDRVSMTIKHPTNGSYSTVGLIK